MEENLFTLAKKRSIVSEGASAVSTLLGIQTADQKSYFSIEYAIKEYLGLSDSDLELNKKYKEGEILKNIEIAKLQKKHAADKLAQTPQEGAPTVEGADNFSAPAAPAINEPASVEPTGDTGGEEPSAF